MAKKRDILTIAEIDAFAARLKATVRAAERGDELQEAVARFVAGGGTLAGGRGRGRGRAAAAAPVAAGRKGPRKRKPGIPPQKVLELVKAAKGPVSIGELAKKLSERPPRVRAALQKLRADKVVKMSGERASAKWSIA